MFRILVLITLLPFTQSLFGQELITDSTIARENGIYGSFIEFKYNCPHQELPTNFSIENVEVHYDENRYFPELEKRGDYTFYRINLDKNEIKNIYGFCVDGAIFLKYNSRGALFTKVEHLGKYALYKEVEYQTYVSVVSYAAVGVPTGSRTVLQSAIINMQNGTIHKLTKHLLQLVLVQDSIALTQFLTEKKKDEKLTKYLKDCSEFLADDVNNFYTIDFTGNSTTKKSNLFYRKNIVDSSYTEYLDRIEQLEDSPMYLYVNIVKKYYRSGSLKSAKINSRHRFGTSTDQTYPIGTHISFYENGQIAKLVDYDLKGRRRARHKEYDVDGNIIANYKYIPKEKVLKKK